MEKREEKIDLLKGLATVLVVIGHNIAYGSGITYLNNENFYDNFLFKVIYSFHMPLFMLLSGYVFLFSINRYDPIKIIFRKVRQLLLPVFSWQTIWYIAFMVCKGGTFSVKGWFVSCLNSIWFLWAAFFCAMIVILGHILFDDHEIYYIILWILMFFMPDVGSTALYKFVYPYFVIGYLYHKRKASFESKNIKTSAAVSACVWLQLLQFYDYNSYIYNSGYFMQPKVDVYRFAIGLAGSIFVIAMVGMIHTNSAETNALGGVKKIGKESMGIYIISSYGLSLLKALPWIEDLNYFVTLFETILMIALSLGIIFIIRNNPILEFLFLGGSHKFGKRGN